MKSNLTENDEQAVFAAVTTFLQERAEKIGKNRYKILLFPQAVQKDANKYLYLPVQVQGEGLDAYDKARILQKLQDAWNEQTPRPAYHVTLRPAGVPV